MSSEVDEAASMPLIVRWSEAASPEAACPASSGASSVVDVAVDVVHVAVDVDVAVAVAVAVDVAGMKSETRCRLTWSGYYYY